MVSYEPQNILLPNLVWWCCRMSQIVMRYKNCLLSSRSRSQRELTLSKYYSDCYIFWTVNVLATKLGLMIGYYRPERLVEKLDYCIQGQGHSEGSKCRCLPRWYFLNRQTFCYQTRIVMHHNEHHAKKVVCYFQGQGHTKGSYEQNMTVSTVCFELLILLLQNLVW